MKGMLLEKLSAFLQANFEGEEREVYSVASLKASTAEPTASSEKKNGVPSFFVRPRFLDERKTQDSREKECEPTEGVTLREVRPEAIPYGMGKTVEERFPDRKNLSDEANFLDDIDLCVCVSETRPIEEFLEDSVEEDGFAKQLNLYMYERDITTAMIYKRCFVDRKLISKITGSANYHPSKNTVLALCVGLQLNLQEAEAFLSLAGYCFSTSSKMDMIYKFLLMNEVYDLDEINECLYTYGQPCLGA